MAVKNTLLGGTDWLSTDKGSYADLNDTFDAAVNLSNSQAPFFVDSDRYTVYDAFTSAVSSTLWDTTNGAIWSNSVLAGGTAGELQLIAADAAYPGEVTESTYSKLIPSNRHIWCRLYFAGACNIMSTDGVVNFYAYIGNTTDGWTLVWTQQWKDFETDNVNAFNTSLLVVAKGSDVYDAYLGGVEVLGTTLANGCQIKIVVGAFSTGGNTLTTTGYIDDVRHSKIDI